MMDQKTIRYKILGYFIVDISGDYVEIQLNRCQSCSHKEINMDATAPKLLDQVRDAIRRKHYSIRTEASYID